MNAILGWLLGLLALVPGMGPPAPPSWNGYVEIDYVYAAAPSAGRIAAIAVREGQTVAKGDVLFTLESTQQQGQYAAARARAEAAQASLENLQTGSRQEEIAVTRASLLKAQADLALAEQNLARSEDLFKRGLVPEAKLDQDKAARQSAQATVDQLQAQLKVQELPARDAQQIAAEASLAAARADAETARAALADRTVVAPESGRVERLFFSGGEVAGAGVPVLSMRGDDAVTVKFYVGEADRPHFALGQPVSVTCDGCPAGLRATVSYFASDPQFTPPVIYSRDERQRLVFLTEATMAADSAILPGQPVSIGLVP
jgi:HlyD family secretion protein